MEEDTTTPFPDFSSWIDELLQSPAHSSSMSVIIEDVATLFAEEPIEDVQWNEPIQQVQEQNQAETSRSALLQPTHMVDPWNEQLVAYFQPPTFVPSWQQSTVVASTQQLQVQPVCKQEYYVNQVQMEPEGAISGFKEKKYACPYCDQKFNSDKHLGRHITSQHPGERPYKCEYEGCNGAFAWRGALRRHIKIHTQETRYQCPLCERTFCRRDNMFLHKRRYCKRRNSPHFDFLTAAKARTSSGTPGALWI